MRKLFFIIATFIITFAFRTQPVFAITEGGETNALSIRLEQPKTPTNQTDFDITFVTLDLMGRDVTVNCYKKSPTDADFVLYGSAQTFADGGNTGVCTVTSSILNTKGNYTFKTTATAGSDTVEDTTVVSYNNEGPGDPTGYNKERANTCDYKIKFHSADDAGKTVKVEVYRSENKSFAADSGSRVDTITIGSNTDGQSITTPPSCDKPYYFGIRAFDSAGNGSNIVGDSEATFTTSSTSTTVTGTTPSAIALTNPSEGSVLGNEVTASEEGKVLGEETTPAGMQSGESFFKKNGILILGIALLVIGIIGLYVSKKKTNQKKLS
ncbi:MAG: hypothetical protein WAV51_01700 [Microgenomates group bacterium]